MKNKKSTVIFIILLSLAVLVGLFVTVTRLKDNNRANKMLMDNLYNENSQEKDIDVIMNTGVDYA